MKPGWNPLLWLNVLSLDAPLVATSWQWVIGVSLDNPPSAIETTVLWLVTWCAYVADRLHDVRRFDNRVDLPSRHRFARRHAMSFKLLLAAGVLAGNYFVWTGLGLVEQELGAMLAGVVGIYWIWQARHPRHSRTFMPREVVVAIAFAVASTIFVLPDDPRGLAEYRQWTSMFALLCLANLVGISCWEADRDRAMGEVSLATRLPVLQTWYPWILASAGTATVLIAVFTMDLTTSRMSGYCGVSCLLLLVLDRLPGLKEMRPALADLSIGLPVWANLL